MTHDLPCLRLLSAAHGFAPPVWRGVSATCQAHTLGVELAAYLLRTVLPSVSMSLRPLASSAVRVSATPRNPSSTWPVCPATSASRTR